MKSPIVTLLLSLCALSASAQTVYRCGSAYSQSPCPQATRVDASDMRTDAQRTDSLRVTAEQRRLADRMEGDRLALAATQKPHGATSLSGAPASPKPAVRARAKKPRKPKKPAQLQ